ncbi:hypothetical protein V8G54_036852 [Vigna mungo]|uniref:Uncharacterized protein n=1 Tax=Vigna mungo TaxID=3915 RepID=A0AAQ3RDC5_VIGMU
MRSPVKPPYEPGMCARRLTHYMYQQQHRPEVRIILDIVFSLNIYIFCLINDAFTLNLCRIITLNSGGNLLLSILLRMPKRSGVFPCMEVADKLLEFSLRSAARENLINYF